MSALSGVGPDDLNIAGLIQRAELLDHILTDLHGDQRLITGGWLPPELIHAHRGYLRPCHGMKLASKRQLVLYAADLARGPDGRMWIVNDRTQAPSGSGYVVENRGVMTRAMPRLFHRTGIRRIAGFFRTLRETLESFPAHAGAREPRVVILTPGPQNETYFEQAFLASYLGYSLVQGDDLTVRDGDLPAETVPVVWHNPSTSAAKITEGDDVVVVGRVRRRFFRVAGSTASRTEVHADTVLSSRSTTRIRTALLPRVEGLNL